MITTFSHLQFLLETICLNILLVLDFIPNTFPKCIVLLAKLFVEPVVDDRVAEVVYEGQVHPLVVQIEGEYQVEACIGEKEAQCDSREHLHDQNMLRPLLLDRCTSFCRVSSHCATARCNTCIGTMCTCVVCKLILRYCEALTGFPFAC